MLADPVYALFRRVQFPGKGRLRLLLRVPSQGVREARFPGGMRLRLDLRESIQRDWYAGLYDHAELALVRQVLREGGDFVDVGAHVGLYTVTAALALGLRGRVLSLEPNPAARTQLETNVRINSCENVLVVGRAAAAGVGEALLHVPATPDPSFSSLDGGRYVEGEPLPVETTTVDREVERAELDPVLVKIDVEGSELDVLAGMERTLAARPALLVEVGSESAAEAERRLSERGYHAYRVGGRRLELGLAGAPGTFNAFFDPGLTPAR